MRSAILVMAPVFLSASLTAQGVFSNGTQVILEKVIQDYPNHFNHLRGELIDQALQSARYRSTVQLPGSTSSTVTVTGIGVEGSGWNCTILETADFNAARTRFAETYEQLSNSVISTEEQKAFILSGQFESATEDRKFTRIAFSLLPGVGELKKLKVDLCLFQNEAGTWRIILIVTDREPKDAGQWATAGS